MNYPVGIDQINRQMFLLFRVQGELYGTPVSGVREVVTFTSPRPVPNTKKFYLGILNLKGEIVGVIDMRFWFQDSKSVEENVSFRALIVFDSPAGLVAVAAEVIESICALENKEIEYSKSIPSSFSSGGMIGLGRFKQGLATLLDLRALLSQVDVAAERKERWVS
jgi:purine-binding chemotaxis protein CheW